jgi:hypothetical protein
LHRCNAAFINANGSGYEATSASGVMDAGVGVVPVPA